MARVVPNLYPAFERQEVVSHSPRHIRSFADAADEEVPLVAEAWQRRRADEPNGYLFALINEGRLAGASLAHSHSQLVWMDGVPPAMRQEQPRVVGHAVFETADALVAAPAASRVPYELRIEPARRDDDPFRSDALAGVLRALREAVRRLRAIEGNVPWNAWLHAGGDWHLELFPRLTVLAGIELGAGIYVNTLPPEEAAAALQSAAV